MEKRIILLMGFWWMIINSAFVQEKYNYVIIHEDDTAEEIVRKAANVVPTDRQLRWQQLELTAFFRLESLHFSGK
jgi:alpha-L-fucosidase